ncbi:hypothetical protein [Allomesorhizobium alhagi]|uniref:RecF/RecN/SMC N-terminal domain-containing protein n=1 Tax=Mesorhizobium alhagi CCNWXJ12-2 TaxID=1107882 RepID=H0I099_9HYPH|nr:hypothetical protein [Mesorhizobium alhagi]EHK53559.1 hypothetical protein MAXJ12_29430 [Mesorhizobium alhagi CCNWXJ12-2]
MEESIAPVVLADAAEPVTSPEPLAAAPRIRRIDISDFRAFPSICPGAFDLDDNGCNLLVFGENGAGKSSIYRALRGLFSINPPDIVKLHNVFTEPPAPSVRVTLTDNSVLAWTAAGHPSSDVVDTARRSAFLTHNRLREMNYSAAGPDTPPNLFDLAVTHLLADFEIALEGGGTKRNVGELWQELQTAFNARVTTATGRRRPQHYIRDVEAACKRFNEAMRQALEALEEKARPLLRKLLSVLSADDFHLVGLHFSPIRYREETRQEPRALENQMLTPTVRFRTHQPSSPQSFLNEARQSALAIAIYLAARLACVPPGKDRLKLLVMDDLLISLDATHRRPVLEAITTLFHEWQIILLTHDRYWFQLAREQLSAEGWKAMEIYERLDGDGLLVPIVRSVSNDMAEATLRQAEAFLDENHPAAASNYARSACELVLRRFCIKRGVKFPYFQDDRRPDLNDLLTAAKTHVAQDQPRLDALKGLEPHKRFVLNPYSHDLAVPVPVADVRAAITAVREVAKAYAKNYAG